MLAQQVLGQSLDKCVTPDCICQLLGSSPLHAYLRRSEKVGT